MTKVCESIGHRVSLLTEPLFHFMPPRTTQGLDGKVPDTQRTAQMKSWDRHEVQRGRDVLSGSFWYNMPSF